MAVDTEGKREGAGAVPEPEVQSEALDWSEFWRRCAEFRARYRAEEAACKAKSERAVKGDEGE